MTNIKKPKFIKRNEKNLGVLSSITLDFSDDSIYKFIDNRSFLSVWSDATLIDEKIVFNNKIYKSKQGFYLYLFIEKDKKSTLIVYYKEDQNSELTIFIQQLLKQFNKYET